MPLHLSRRTFLKALGLTTAGLAIGGGAAIGSDQLLQAANTISQTAAQARQLESQLAFAQSGARLTASELADVRAQLAAALEANARLAADLSMAQTRNETLTGQLAESTTQLQHTQAALVTHQEHLGAARTLIQLFDALENTGLDTALQTGLTAALGGLVGATTLAPAVRAGTAAAHALLDDLENTRQAINAALIWLNDQVIQLKLSLLGVEQASQAFGASAAGAALGGVISAFALFTQQVLRWVPFGWGDPARQALTATQNHLEKSHTLARDVNDSLFKVAARHFADTPNNLSHRVAQPVRDQALAPAEALSQAVEHAHTTLETQLAQPARAALDQRARLRDQIARFRAEHGL